MKKLTVFIFVLLFTVGLVSCGIKGKETLRIEFAEWEMCAIMNNSIEPQGSEKDMVVAVGMPDELYPDVKIVEMTLTAKGGKLTLNDATNGKSYEGTYEIAEETSKGIRYDIVLDGIVGSIYLSPTEYYSGTELPTLPMDIGEYSLYFVPNEQW